MKSKNLGLAVGLVVLALVGFGVWYLMKPSQGVAKQPTSSGTGAQAVAVVNGAVIAQAEIEALMANGLERASAVDQRITQAVMAGAAEKQFPEDSARALSAGRTELLAQLYAQRRMAALQASITEQDIAKYYEANLAADEFKQFKLRFVIAKDAAEAQSLYSTMTTAPGSVEGKAALDRMQYLSKANDHFLLAQEVPYGIGNVVKKMKAGELMQPILVREGILIVKIEEIRQGDRPQLAKVAQEIRAFLANQKMSEEVQQLRKSAQIELKS